MLLTVQLTIAGAALPLQMRVEGGGQRVVHWKGYLVISKVDEVEVEVLRLRLRGCHLSNAGCRSSQGEDRWTIPICRRGCAANAGGLAEARAI